MMNKYIVFFLLFLCGCTVLPEKYKYTPEQIAIPVSPTWEKYDVEVVWHPISSKKLSDFFCSSLFVAKNEITKCKKGKYIEGFTIPARYSIDHKCHIYCEKPKKYGDFNKFMVLGHELLHCIYGFWHGNWPIASEDEKKEKLQQFQKILNSLVKE